jgi:hypothetical protein
MESLGVLCVKQRMLPLAQIGHDTLRAVFLAAVGGAFTGNPIRP